ncbi:MAG: tRNA threonylcarbamoyladenosine dehydratase [Ruminococcaceae bacterium]|nr:tRNA threonylcarbamoyladenosine dehydratase [Oscillospiraceae bacterium]
MKSEYIKRTSLMLGEEAVKKLENATVAVFGLGGVGGAMTEALARCGVGHLMLVDGDTVSETNINRQIIALTDTVGMAKTQAMKERVMKINPDIKLTVYTKFFTPDTADEFDFDGVDYIADAIDMVSAKLLLAEIAQQKGIPAISAMGTGNKLDPTKFEVADISKTSVCPLARVMRRELKARGVKKLKVVYSKEEPHNVIVQEDVAHGKHPPASVSFVPPVMGYIMAGEIIKDISGITR